MQAARNENFGKAYRIWRPLSEKDYAPAQYNLGLMYGKGLPKDLGWYQKAAEGGLAIAQYKVGMAFLQGRGIGRNYSDAVVWLQKSADQNYVKAMHNLGVMYNQGLGVS